MNMTEAAELTGIGTMAETDLAVAVADITLWPLRRVRETGTLLLRGVEGEVPRALITEPVESSRMSQLEARLTRGIQWYCVTPTALEEIVGREESTRLVSQAQSSPESDLALQDGELLSIEALDATSSSTIRTVNAALYDALRLGASDVHFEMTPAGLQIRYRIDGVLISGPNVADPLSAQQVLSRLKVMAQLDIAERRIPQDGRFVARAMKRRIDFRISVMPSAHGEDAVVRLLDKHHLMREGGVLRLEALGFDVATCETLRMLAAQPYGMLLVTGPTGSGKTTTLYALVSEVHNGTEKVVTIEDPIEYELPGILQIPVNEKKGLTFARGLRSILRHDPDRIMVGEIRDAETAEIAIQSALTGHAVFTTVHANNIFDVVGRFTHMGIDIDNFVAALNGVVAQRLVRLVCDRCAREQQPGPALLARSGLAQSHVAGWRFVEAVGCATCRLTGYQGRAAISERLTMDDELRQMIRDRVAVAVLKREAKVRGVAFLRESALELVRHGKTTLTECNRITVALPGG